MNHGRHQVAAVGPRLSTLAVSPGAESALHYPDNHRIAWPAAIVRYRHAPSLTFVPSAGCYVLKAQWKRGGWTIPFTAGG